MLEVELWDYHLHTHFSWFMASKGFSISIFKLRFRVNMFLENSLSFGKTIFGKTSFYQRGYLSKCFNMLE